MRDKKKAILNTVFLILVFSLTVYMVFRGEDLGEIIHTVQQADLVYLLISVVCVVLFILGESVIIFYMMRTLGAKVKMGHCALYSFVGFFFSCLTPSASGGQPMQIYYMKKGQTADTGHYTGSDDRYHYLQGGSGCNRSGYLAVWKGIPERLPRTVDVGVLTGSRAEYFLCYFYADPCICSGSGEMDHGKRSETD